MSECELLSTCPFFNDGTQDFSGMSEADKEQYCKGDYAWCGKFMAFKALEKGLERTSSLDLPRKKHAEQREKINEKAIRF